MKMLLLLSFDHLSTLLWDKSNGEGFQRYIVMHYTIKRKSKLYGLLFMILGKCPNCGKTDIPSVIGLERSSSLRLWGFRNALWCWECTFKKELEKEETEDSTSEVNSILEKEQT